MAYKIKGKNGLPIKKDGEFLLGYDIPATKIEQMDEKNLSFLAVGSTEDEDRDKDIIRVNGWQLKNFKNNPVLPWSHNYYTPPVGKAVSIKKDKNKKKLIFKAQFDADDDYARMIFNKYKNGFLSTFSVGFIPQEFVWRDEENRWYGGREYIKQELLEISPVTVPCNPGANTDVRSLTDDLPPTLAQEGYKHFVCKLDSGLFVPVGDTEIYTGTSILPVSKGIKGVYGSIIDNPDAEKELVGYLFESDMEEKEASQWVNDNGYSVSRVKYFDMSGDKFIGEKDFELEVVEEEIKTEKSVEEEIEEVEEEIETEENEIKEIKSELDEEEIEEIETKEMEDEEEMSDDEDMECMVAMSISVKNMEGKELKSKNKKKKMMLNEVDMDEMMKRAFSKKDDKKEFVAEIKITDNHIKQIVDKLKKSLVKEEEIDNNEVDESEIELEEENKESNDEEIEFDSSLLSPVSEDENEDFVELDEKVFEEVKSQMKSEKVNFKDILEKSIKDALNGFSGKLED
jgi:HK97 family phage prohead protease